MAEGDEKIIEMTNVVEEHPRIYKKLTPLASVMVRVLVPAVVAVLLINVVFLSIIVSLLIVFALLSFAPS